MKKIFALLFSALLILCSFVSCTSLGKTGFISKSDVKRMFTSAGFTVVFEDWPPSRSGNYPADVTPSKIIKIDDKEEIWLFEFDYAGHVEADISFKKDNSKGVYYKDLFILMYQGKDKNILKVLNSNFNEAYWNWDDLSDKTTG